MTQMPQHAVSPGPRPLDVDRPTVAFGVALLSTAVVLSTFYTRLKDHLDWSNYVVGLVATVGLLGIAAVAVAGLVVPRDADTTIDLVAWPGAFGALGVGLMIGVGLDDSRATEYVAGLAVLAISVAGYALVRRAPFVVTAIVGIFVVYAQLLDDVIGFGGGDDIGAIWMAVALTVFAVAITGAGWLLPTRALSGVVAGAVTVAGFASLTGVLAVVSAFQAVFAPANAEFHSSNGQFQSEASGLGSYDNDTWVILVLALLLMVGWAACAALTRHVGFRILVVAMAVSVTPLATVVLRAQHPTWWGVVIGAVGGGLLLAVMVRHVDRSGGVQQAAPAAPTGPPPSTPPPYTPPPAAPPA
jgi:hypothetical protein